MPQGLYRYTILKFTEEIPHNAMDKMYCINDIKTLKYHMPSITCYMYYTLNAYMYRDDKFSSTEKTNL